MGTAATQRALEGRLLLVNLLCKVIMIIIMMMMMVMLMMMMMMMMATFAFENFTWSRM